MARLTLWMFLACCVVLPARVHAEDSPTQEAGTLRVPVLGAIETLDPPKAATDAARLAVVNIYDQLFEYEHLARPYGIRPALAAALPEVSEDRKQQTIRLRKGIQYAQDPCLGPDKTRTVTADDVVYCIKRMMDAHTESPGQWMLTGKVVGLDAFVAASAKARKDPNRQQYRTEEGYPDVPGLEVVDEHTLRIHLVEPMPELSWLLASAWFSVYPPEAVRVYGTQLGSKAVGTGPYRVVMHLPGKKLLLRANRRFRQETFPESDEDGPEADLAGQRLPRSPVVEVLTYATELRAWQAFLNGDVDLAEVPRDAFHENVNIHTQELLPHLAKRGVALMREPRAEIHYDAFNMQDPVLGQPAGEKGRAIRRAICLAADDTYALTRLYANRSERVYGPILPEFVGYDPDFVNEWQRQPDESREEAVALAKETLAAAGLEGGKGVPTLAMHILTDASSRRLFEILQKQLAEIGLDVQPKAVGWKELQALLKERKCQMFSSSWYADYPSAQNFLQLFYGPLSPEPNYANYRSKAFDALYDEAASLPADEDPAAIYEEMQEVVMQDCPWRYRLRRIRWEARHGWLSGYHFNEFAPKFFKFCRVIDAERKAAIEAWKQK